MLVILAFGRLRQENHEFKSGLGYKARPCLKKLKTKPKSEPKNPPVAHEGEGIYSKLLGLSDHFFLKGQLHVFKVARPVLEIPEGGAAPDTET
jgi:hypothetical protein